MRYEFINKVDGFTFKQLDTDDVDLFVMQMDFAGMKYQRLSSNPRTRQELQGHPVFAGVIGPCWGGEGAGGEPIIRYESTEAYRELSA